MSMIMATWTRALCVLLLLLGVALVTTTEAAKIETFNDLGCQGSPVNIFYVGRNQCQTFIDQASVHVTEIDADTRVSFHNQLDCEGASSVAQGYGPQCRNQGGTKLRAVYIA